MPVNKEAEAHRTIFHLWNMFSDKEGCRKCKWYILYQMQLTYTGITKHDIYLGL